MHLQIVRKDVPYVQDGHHIWINRVENLHIDTSINMTASKSNILADRRLIKIEVEAVKVNMDLAMIPKNPILFMVWL